MKKGRGSDSDFDRAKKVLEKHSRDKGITMKKSYPPDIDRFKVLLEKHFLGKKEKEISSNLSDRFRSELETLGLSKEDIFLNLVHYFSGIFCTATMKTTRKPLHTSRDFALEIYAKVFFDMLIGLKEPVKSEKIPVSKADLILFLVGIVDAPFEFQSLFDSPSSISYRLKSFAEGDEPILITGETGTGKEFHAKAIHYLSPRSKKKFMAINCAGIPEALLESELFGYEKGAHSNALTRKDGLLHEVGEGTLFLDEIGDMSISLQAKVLRFLQSGDYRRVGGTEILQFEGRVIAATNRNLRAEIEKTPPIFRPDLFYRLNVLPIKLPSFHTLSLYERRMAILIKLRHIMQSKTDQPGNCIEEMHHLSGPGGCVAEIGPDGNLRVIEHPLFSEVDNPYITEGAMQLLSHYNFPGNYRELDNIIRRAYILSGGKRITEDLLRIEGIEIKETKAQEVRNEEPSVTTIMLKDIIKHADGIKADIVRRKIEEVYTSGKNLKEVLFAEGAATDSAYQTFRNRVQTIIGKGEIGRIDKECKLRKEINRPDERSEVGTQSEST